MPDDVPKTAMSDKHVEMMELRAQQLDFRVREVYDAYACFTSLLDSPAKAKFTVDDLEDATAAEAFVAQFRGRVDMADLQLAGHSFGGGTLLRLLSSAVPADYTPLPAKHAVLLDPWVEPALIAAPLPEAPAPPPPTTVINSQEWTDHAMFPKELAQCVAMNASVATIVGMAREFSFPISSISVPSCISDSCSPDGGFSDFALLYSGGPARAGLQTIHAITMGTLTDTLAEVPAMQAAPDGGEPARTGGKVVGSRGQVLVHSVAWKAAEA
jgi:platelet-activating factor acetylhydrolase